MLSKTWLLIVFGSMITAAAVAQNMTITIRVFDGKNGKQLANQRLLVFGGQSTDGPRFHETVFDIKTDQDGLAQLTFDPTKTSWIQVWIDGMTLCQKQPNMNSYSIDAITNRGLAAPNTCSSVSKVVAPGNFVVFARPANLREKMGR